MTEARDERLAGEERVGGGVESCKLGVVSFSAEGREGRGRGFAVCGRGERRSQHVVEVRRSVT